METLLQTIRLGAEIEGQVLTDLGLRPDKVYLRTITHTGADPILGIKGTQTVKDTPFTYNPKVKDVNIGMVAKGNGYLEMGDIFVYLSANEPEATLQAANYWVYKNKLFKLIKIDGDPDASTPVEWKCLLRKHASL